MGDLDNGWTVSDAFPEHPLTADELETRLSAARAETTPWDDPGQTRLGFAMAAPAPSAVRVWSDFLAANTNNVGVHTGFGAGAAGTRRLEREALLSLAGLYHADSAEGHVTSGATEAVIQGLRIGRNATRDSPHARVAVITGEFAHHSVAKAAEILGLDYRPVPADQAWTLSAEAVERAADEAVRDGATGIVVVATAGYYNSGLCDPIAEMSLRIRERAARDAGRVRYFFYVDAAHGGFVFPFTAPDLAFDFRNPGVHAMAVDPHKSGLLPYSCGVLLARRGLLQHVTAVSPVTGVVDDTLIGSRPGAAAAALWAVLFGHGRSRFTELAHTWLAKRDALAEAIRSADPRCVLRVAPHAPVVTASFDVPQGRLPQELAQRYRLVPILAPAADGGRRLHYHFYAGQSLTPAQIAGFGEALARAVTEVRAEAAPRRPSADDSDAARDLLPPTACFRHFAAHPPGRRDPDAPGYSFHTFTTRRSTGEELRHRPWGVAPSGRQVTLFAPDLARPFANELFGVHTDVYTAEILDRHQQKLSLVGAVHFCFPLAEPGCQALLNFESTGAFRSVEYKFGGRSEFDEIQCFTDRTVVKFGKNATGVRRPHSDAYSFSVDTSLECVVLWQNGDAAPRLTSHRHYSDVLLPRRRHLNREQYSRFPNRFFDGELELRAGRGHSRPWRLSQFGSGDGVLARSALTGLSAVDVEARDGQLSVSGRSLPAGRSFALSLPVDLGCRLSEALPALDVSRPEELTTDAAVQFAEAVYTVMGPSLPVRDAQDMWHVSAPPARPAG
ncbi:hypothetical protein GCM10022384_59550 [Streptomyces marokkonensis]|uniref:Uncharacterized protein n=1 Tax=Streptomyces marokkonensis TaxID=324855 RepID=A0ABP7S161_9ACTN